MYTLPRPYMSGGAPAMNPMQRNAVGGAPIQPQVLNPMSAAQPPQQSQNPMMAQIAQMGMKNLMGGQPEGGNPMGVMMGGMTPAALPAGLSPAEASFLGKAQAPALATAGGSGMFPAWLTSMFL